MQAPVDTWSSQLFVRHHPNPPVVSFSAAQRSVIAWLAGRQPPQPSKSELQLEQRIVDLLAEELAENKPPVEAGLPRLEIRPSALRK